MRSQKEQLLGTISNTATATYEDDDGNSIEAVSNTVTIEVAEVAGITAVSSGFADENDGSIVGGDELYYYFLVTNTGNATTDILVPGPDQIGVTNGTITSVDVVDNPTDDNDLQNIAAGGETVDEVDPDDSFTIRVTVTATTLSDPTGEFVAVQFGDTSENTVSPATTETDDDGNTVGRQNQQNIPDDTDSGAESANGVVTRNPEGPGVAPAPINGEREAAASRSEAFNTAPTDLAQALLLKTSAYSDSTTTANPSDDTIVYNLELQIGNQPSLGIDPGNLEGTTINLDGDDEANRILVSDAIPANSEYDPGFTPTAPTDWTVVYSITPLTTNAQDAEWTTAEPTTAAAITRIGFVYDADTDGALTPSTPAAVFSFGVITNGISTPGGQIANIAQVFGETEGDTANNLVFDESGDQQPNNLDDGVNPADNTTTFDPDSDFGVGNTADPEENLNDNDGTGPNGESNVVTIAVPVAGNLFNGPDGVPSATGPNNTNDDFTNAVAEITTPGPQDTSSNPEIVEFQNQVQNPAGAPTRLDTVTLLPISATEALAAAGAGTFGDNDGLPDDTLVEIEFNDQSTAYSYAKATGFTPINSLADPTPATAGSPEEQPVLIGTLEPGDIENYTVRLDLPSGTAQVRGYGVPIAAFVDNDGDGLFTPLTETVSNITIDRAYTGFMKLVKEARVIYAERDGSTPTNTAFTDDQTLLNAINNLTPGDAIEYQITYENISEEAPSGGFGNAVLNANNFVLVENGTATVDTVDDTGAVISTDNNWAEFTTHLKGTFADYGDISYEDLAGPTYTADPDDGTKVDIYTNTVDIVAPNTSGSLIFRREVTDEGPTPTETAPIR